MTPEEKELLKRSVDLAEDNNIMLRAMRRSMRISRFMSIIYWVFIIGSAIVGAAGILVGFDTGLEPTMGLALLLKGVIAAIVGGVGSISGAFLGAFLLGFVENFGIWHISGEWKDAIAFAVLILFLLFRPQGILGKK